MLQYQKAKTSHALLNTYITFLEQGVMVAKSKVDPFVEKVHTPLEKLGTVACKGLDKVEEIFPAVKMTPQEVQEVGVKYYGNSYVKRGVESALGVGAKLDGAKNAISAALVAQKNKATGFASAGVQSLQSSLSYCEYVVDTYVVEEEQPKEHDYASTSIQERLRVILGKIYSWVQLKASRRLNSSVKFIQLQFGSMEEMRHLLNTAKLVSQLGDAKHKLLDSAGSVQRWTAQKMPHVEIEATLLHLFQQSTSVIAVVSVKALSLASHTLSPSYASSLSSLQKQLDQTQKFVANARTFHEITEEAKEKLVNEETLNEAYEYLSTIPPFTWIDRKHHHKKGEGEKKPEIDDSSSSSSDSSDSDSD
jgi:hypothetical protein